MKIVLKMKSCNFHGNIKNSLVNYWYNLNNISAYKIANSLMWKKKMQIWNNKKLCHRKKKMSWNENKNQIKKNEKNQKFFFLKITVFKNNIIISQQYSINQFQYYDFFDFELQCWFPIFDLCEIQTERSSFIKTKKNLICFMFLIS